MINMKHVIFNLMLISIFLTNANSNSNYKRNAVNDDPDDVKKKSLSPLTTEDALKKICLNEINITKHFDLMDGIDDRYAEVREKYQKAVESDNFDKEMLDMMLKTRGAAESAIHSAAGNSAFIPAGINLVGYSLIFFEKSHFFFHRLKLRNNTHFRVNFLHNDLANMVLTAKLSLNDLHIVGAYERMIWDKDWDKLFYAPAFGEVEFLLRNVQYTAEGRYRLLRDKLWIELIVSDLDVSDILMMHINKKKENKPFPLERNIIGELLNLLKINLDKWLKDYINDNLMYYAGNKASANFLKYNQEKTIALNEYADYVLEKINKRLQSQYIWTVYNFNITAINGVKIIFHSGKYKTYHRIYRRSFATCKKDGKLRKIDTIVGLSNFEVYLEYEAVTHTGMVLKEYIVVSVDEIIAHMGVTLTKDLETFEIKLDSIQHIKLKTRQPFFDVNLMLGPSKHMLKMHVLARISYIIYWHISGLNFIEKCEHTLEGYTAKQVVEDGNEEEENVAENPENSHIKQEEKLILAKSKRI